MGRYGEVKSVCLGKFKRPPQFIVYQQTRSHDMRGESITRFHSYCNMSLHNTDERRVHNTCEGPLHDIHRRARPICKHKNHPIIRAARARTRFAGLHHRSARTTIQLRRNAKVLALRRRLRKSGYREGRKASTTAQLLTTAQDRSCSL